MYALVLVRLSLCFRNLRITDRKCTVHDARYRDSLPQPLRAMLGNSSILEDVCVGGSDGARHGGICAGVNGSEDCNDNDSEAAFATITLGDVSGVTTHVDHALLTIQNIL